MNNIFYCSSFINNIGTLSEQESMHCKGVLRKKIGEHIIVTDGLGNENKCVITDQNKRSCVVQVIKSKFHSPLRYHILVAISPIKNNSRFECFLEKATELGVNEITPIVCTRTEKAKLNYDRLNQILISAMKQSGQYYLPKLNEAIAFNQFVKENSSINKFICFVDNRNTEMLFNQKLNGNNSTVMIGPEGDFTNEEIDLALENGFIKTSLGKSVLRTETAGVIGVHSLQIAHQTIEASIR